MILFNDDGTVTLPREKFDHTVYMASKNWQAEIAVINAYVAMHPDLFSPEHVQEAGDEFDHGIRQFLLELQELANNAVKEE